MPQTDQTTANLTFPATRTKNNQNFAALFSLSSGTSFPSTTVAGMWCYRTDDGWIYQRNAADSGWVAKFKVDAQGFIPQDGSTIYAADGEASDAYAITLDPAITAYSAGMVFNFKANTANTGACTLAVSGLAAKAIKKNKDQDLETGDILSGQTVSVIFDGTNFQVLSPLMNTADVNAQTGTSYTIVAGDRGNLVTLANASAIAVTLPQAGTTGFERGFYFDIQNTGAGTVTITPTTSTIDGAANLTLTTDQGCRIFSDGTNYHTMRGISGTGVFSESYTSSNQTLTNSGDLSLAHGLSSTPYLIQPFLKCTTADGNYSVGDMVPISYTGMEDGQTDRFLNIIPDATNLEVRMGAQMQAWNIVDKSTNANFNITSSSWRLVIKAWA